MSEYIFKNSVFIIGAGASKPYGVPVGSELKKEILKLCNDHPEHGWTPNNLFTHAFLGHLMEDGYGLDDLKKFCEDFEKVGAETIDSFLQHYDEDGGRYSILGKRIIYFYISIYENQAVLRGNNWIETLVQYSMREHQEEFLRDSPLFISFNYDNLLKAKVEFILKTQFRIQDFKFKGRIQHVYGKTTGDGFVNKLVSAYTKEDYEEIVEESKRLALIRDGNNEYSSVFQGCLERASKVFVLGYGFDPTNNKIVFGSGENFRKLIKEKKVYATAMGLDKSFVKEMNNLSQDEKYVPFRDVDCNTLISGLIPKKYF